MNTTQVNLQPETTLSQAQRHNGVTILTKQSPEFEAYYRQAREKEGRWYPDEVVKKLPYAHTKEHHSNEWRLRVRSSVRMLQLIAMSPDLNRIMDLGCGNGWFSRRLAGLEGKTVWGVDLNQGELEQAARLFKAPNLEFVYADIFNDWPTHPTLDVIVVNSAIQYFENLPRFVERMFQLLRPGGELHILDSPFYRASKIKSAQQRTQKHYAQLGVPEMAKTYHHHTLAQLKTWNPEVLFNPSSVKNQIVRSLGRRESPFYWVQVLKPFPEREK